MACGLIKASLFVVLCVTFASQASAGTGRCINRNSAPNICNCELHRNLLEENSVGADPVMGVTITAEEFRPRVVGDRFLKKRRNYLTDCVALCLNHLRVKLQQPNVVADGTENEVPTRTFLTTAGKDGLCELIYNDPVTPPPGTVTMPGATEYYFLKASRPCKNENTWSKMTYIGDADCECYRFGGSFQRCFSSVHPDIATATGVITFRP